MKNSTAGYLLVQVLVFAAAGVIIVGGLIGWAGTSLKLSRYLASREQAFQIAEAGVEYYRWHLAHAPTDYSDGMDSGSGPFIHNMKDADGNIIGQFNLTITPSAVGTNIVQIKSKGTVYSSTTDSIIERTILATMAVPSLAKYSIVANDFIRLGSGTEIYGPIHSNNGVRFDALAHNLVTSAKEKFNDTENPGGYVFGVYTTVSNATWPDGDPRSPAVTPDRPDVFMAGRQFPVPVVDFEGLTADISQLKTISKNGGKYLAASGAQGYDIVLKTNDTFDLYKVTSLEPVDKKCKNDQKQDGWNSWSIGEKTFIANYPFPANGVIFAEDHIWVSGKIDGARITIAVGRFPEAPGQYRDITVNTNLLYSNYDGSDVIGLIAQGDINIGLISENTMRIDAALVAQNGRVGRYYYSSDCGSYASRAELTLYGMIATKGRYGFSYTDETGYTLRDIIYDSNLLYSPPPSFPLTSDQYQTISWQEVNE